MSSYTLSIGRIVFNLRRVKMGLHEAFSLCRARVYSSLQYRDKIRETHSRSHIPILKVQVVKSFFSCIMDKLSCSLCEACSVGQRDPHLLIQFREHFQPSRLFWKYIRLCGVYPSFEVKENVSITQSTTRSTLKL